MSDVPSASATPPSLGASSAPELGRVNTNTAETLRAVKSTVEPVRAHQNPEEPVREDNNKRKKSAPFSDS
jgi:hypothetical protein